eukprot:COSAG03_NODE_996_length_5069_cov_7.315091_7_plen_69_part_00
MCRIIKDLGASSETTVNVLRRGACVGDCALSLSLFLSVSLSLSLSLCLSLSLLRSQPHSFGITRGRRE